MKDIKGPIKEELERMELELKDWRELLEAADANHVDDQVRLKQMISNRVQLMEFLKEVVSDLEKE